jgi:formylglycine-generating enzyme
MIPSARLACFTSLAAAGAMVAACGQAKPRPAVPPPAVSDVGVEPPAAKGRLAVATPAETDAGTADAAPAAPAEQPPSGEVPACPKGMILVDTAYCPKIERTCVDKEYSPQNHITICHRFAKEQRCLVPEEHRRFCIDEYEYPNSKGAHPPWMVSWYDAQATCALREKRLCYESEWVAACEGPERTPFPYGRVRDSGKCNIDNAWIDPNLADLYGHDSDARNRELGRLDQSVPSGAADGCKSGFGVYDMTGNFDEWVTAERLYKGKYDKSEWAALKGGAWGHVRNACRPTTTSHPPDFVYYFIAFRCCRDAAGATAIALPKSLHVPRVDPADRAPIPAPVGAPGPSPKKVDRENWGQSGR